MQPMNDRVLLSVYLSERKTPGGLIIPDSANSVCRNRGKVLAVGPGEVLSGTGQHVPPEVSVGDEVLFNHLAGEWIDDEKTQLMIRQCDILAVIDPAANVVEQNRYAADPRDVGHS
jgi:chaperonin GroES